MKICSIEDCSKQAYQRGWCQMHYARWFRNGDPISTKKAPHGEPLEYFTKVMLELTENPTDDCVEWPYKQSHGYGMIGKVLVTHLALGLDTRSKGSWALHSCDNPPCFNPAHLRWGTRQENIDEMIRKGRNVPAKYEKLVAWLDEHGIDFPEEMR